MLRNRYRRLQHRYKYEIEIVDNIASERRERGEKGRDFAATLYNRNA